MDRYNQNYQYLHLYYQLDIPINQKISSNR
jgi:hypothetical protein